MPTVYMQNAESVTSEPFEEETVLINFVSGVYFSLRGSAPMIWDLLQSPISLDELLASIVDDPIVARDAVQAMLDTLFAENCIRTAEVAELSTGRVLVPSYQPYLPPIVETFHDLTELIVIDPIHEVDDIDGWPHRPSPISME